MQLIETKTLGTAAASIEFTSIPQTFDDLFFLITLRGSTATNSQGVSNLANGTVATGRRLDAETGIGVVSQSFGIMSIPHANLTANTFGNASLYLPNYRSSASKSASIDHISENNATYGRQGLVAQAYAVTSAITTFTFTSESGNFIAGSTISLYGITKGSSGGVVVS